MKPQFPSLFVLNFLILCLFHAVNAQTLRPIQLNGKWGYVNNTGKIVVEPQFYWAEEFSEGLAAFENELGQYGYIDETGKIVIEAKFDRWSEFTEGLAAVAIDFKWGFIDKTGKWTIEPQFAHAFPFKDGLAPVRLAPPKGEPWTPGREKRTFIDKTGKPVFAPLDHILNARTSAGLAFLQFFYDTGDAPKSAIMDKTGKVIVEADEIELDGFSEKLTPVKIDKKWGYVDTTGKFVIEPQFEDAKSFSEGLAAVQIGENWGYINTQGKLVIPPKFDINSYSGENHAFSEGLALVFANDRCTFINQTGKTVFKFNCAEAGKFIGGLAFVKIGDGDGEKRGYINKTGKFVWGPTPFKYKTAEDIEAQIKKRREKEGKTDEDEEKLLPLTEEEKALNYRDLVAGQPDFIADLSYFRSEQFSGGGFAYRLARKGNKYRKESRFWIFVGETGKPRLRLNPSEKLYNDLEGVDDETVTTAHDFNPRTLVDDSNTTFTPLGKITIDGHECIKIEAKRKIEGREKEKIYLYAAKDLKNLIIAAQVLNPPYAMVQRLSNITLEVPDNLVNVPADYKPVEKDIWRKVENARVKFGGKFSKDFGVFRSPTGELFVWVLDAPYPWKYLVRPKEATVETAYQGMLMARNGDFIWRTKESEALSETGYRNSLAIQQGKSDTKPVLLKSRTLRFQSNNSDDIWIEVILPDEK